MKPISAKNLAERMGGTYHGEPTRIQGFATDHREVKPGDAFLAIKGARVDGHDFADQAMAAGALLVVSEKELNVPHVRVENLVAALSSLALSFRIAFDGPVVGITGSAGKTMTKEFVAAALSPLGPIKKTDGNRNTEYTAPLLWPEVTTGDAAVVVELSMRGMGQIAHLAEFCRPTHSLITNIGWAHLEQVGSRAAIAQAKGEILEALPQDGVAVLWKDDEFFDSLKARAWPRSTITFGYGEGCDCRIIGYEAVSWQSCLVRGFYLNLPWEAELPVVGRHLALNAAAAIAVAASVGISPQEASGELFGAEIPPMRMEIRDYNGALILLDTYNASVPGTLGAIETLSEMPCDGKRRAVLGEMRELGAFETEAHEMVGKTLLNSKIDEVCFIGEPMVKTTAEMFRASGKPFTLAANIEEVRAFVAASQPGDTVLIKGSRALELERALETLQ